MPDSNHWRRYRLDVPIWSADGHIRPLQEVENDIIRLAVVHYGGNCSIAAERLGISRTNFYRRMKELGISPSVARSP